jgi:ribosome recycling factor
MDKELRKAFSDLKANCNTSEKRKMFNKMLKSFAEGSIESVDQLYEAAHEQAKKIFGDKYDQATTDETIKKILDDHQGENLDACLGIYVNSITNKYCDTMDKDARKVFAQLKAKCDTKAKRLAFNELVKSFNEKKD